jgi:hypothetical protein
MKKTQNKEKITLNIFKKVTSLRIKKSKKKHILIIQKLRFFLNFKNS